MILGRRNVWSCLNADNVGSFPVIDGVGKLIIIGEHCPTNEKARLECGARWYAAGRSVVIDMPKTGKDFNDRSSRGCGDERENPDG
jgi:hypothetical protein